MAPVMQICLVVALCVFSKKGRVVVSRFDMLMCNLKVYGVVHGWRRDLVELQFVVEFQCGLHVGFHGGAGVTSRSDITNLNKIK